MMRTHYISMNSEDQQLINYSMYVYIYIYIQKCSLTFERSILWKNDKGHYTHEKYGELRRTVNARDTGKELNDQT